MLHVQSLEPLQLLEADQLVELVAGAYLNRFHREMLAFVDGLNRFQINARFLQRNILGTGRGAGDEQLVAHIDFGRLHEELCHADVGEVTDALAHVYLALRGRRTVVLRPFTQTLPQVVAVPEAAIEDRSQAAVPLFYLLVRERIVQIGTDGFLVALHHGTHILGAARTASILNTRTPASIILFMK